MVPMGCYSNFSKLTCCRSAVCRCCGQPQLCSRVLFSKIRVSRVCSSIESSDERGFSSIGSRREVRLWEGIKQGTKRSFKEESLRRLVADIVVCVYARAFEAGLASEVDNPHQNPSSRSGEARPLREEGSRFRCRERDETGSFSYPHRNRSVPTPSTDEYTWQGPGGREMTRKGGGRGFHSLDERLRKPARFSDSWTMQGPLQDGEGAVRDRALYVGSDVLERQVDLGNRTAKHYTSRHSSSNIPRSELLKIQELRFSGDMREGDSSLQVLNLQRALFWLGHLPGLSLTGYFGPETTKALQEFHYSNGFSSPGMWGCRSQQLLWKLLYPDQRHLEKGIPENLQREFKEFPSRRFVKNTSEFVASVSSTLPCLKVTSHRVGVVLVTIAILSIIARGLYFCFGRFYGQPLRKRVMSWRNGVNLRRPGKANQSTNVQQVHHKSSDGGQVLRYIQNQLRQKPTKKQEKTGCNLLDSLVLFDGQVVRADHPTNRKMPESLREKLGLINENNIENVSEAGLEGKPLPCLSPKQVYQSGSNIESTRMVHGFDQFQKLEADPPRRISLNKFSPVRSEKSSRLTGWNKRWSRSSPDPGSWVRFLFAPFFPDNDGPYNHRKASSRRAVARINSPRRIASPQRGVPGDLGSHLKFSKLNKGLSAESTTQNWGEETELDLKKQVEELHRTVQSVEQTRVAAMRALGEEKMQNLELEVKIRRQREAAAALEEEVRVLKDSREALLASLKKKYSSSAAARAAAALLYQNWDPSDRGARV